MPTHRRSPASSLPAWRGLEDPSTFDKNVDAGRRNLDFDIDDETALARLKEIDAWALEYITTHSERLLKKTLSRSEVENGYSPLVKTYGATNSCKT